MPVHLDSDFPTIIARGVVKTHESVETAARKIERIAKRRSRVDTGTMRGAWEAFQISDDEWDVFNPVHYTIYNEFGTRYMSAQPMLRPAVEMTFPTMVRDVGRAWRG